MRIDIVTGSRAEYSIMRNLIKKLTSDKSFDVRVIVTGMHLEEKFGMTINDVRNDGVPIYKEIYSNMTESSDVGIITSMQETMNGFKNYFNVERPDAILVLGDRFEIFAVATVASMFRIPIIHLHGGEKTIGNYDEFIRHSITKMSHLHLVSTEEFRNRVVQLGEHPSSVFNVGALGVENIVKSDFYTIEEMSESIDFNLNDEKYLVVSFHPETLNSGTEHNTPVLEALEQLLAEYKVILIGTNSDTNSDIFMRNMRGFEATHIDRVKLLVSVPSKMYYSLVKHADLFVGNSSSGLIEVPSLGTVSINIGDRQKGRVVGNSIIPCETKRDAVLEAIQRGRSFDEEIFNPYGKEGTCDNMIKIIKENQAVIKNIAKDFYDVEVL